MSNTSAAERYHPKLAVADPEAYYADAFRNYPLPNAVRAARVVSRLTSLNARFSYHDASNQDEYFRRMHAADRPVILSFSHRGLQKAHDPLAGLRAVFSSEMLLERAPRFRGWVAVTYMTDPQFAPILQSLGSVPVIRSGDYTHPRFDMQKPDDATRQKVTDAMIHYSLAHLQAPDSVLFNFPGGTKGSEKVQDGVGMVLEQHDSAVAIPVALVSDSETKSGLRGNIPQRLRIAFGQPVEADGITGLDQHVADLEASLNAATASVQ